MSKKLDRSSGGIEITGHKGTWYVIDEGDYKITPDVDGKPETLTAHLFLLESELYGDEAACLIVNEEKQIVLEDVWNTPAGRKCGRLNAQSARASFCGRT